MIPSLSVTDETKIRVLEKADELEYIPLQIRKNPSPKRDRLNIGIVDWYVPSSLIEDPYYLYLMVMVEKILAKEGLNSFRLVETDNGYISTINKKPNGIIAIGRFDKEGVTVLEKISKNIVFIDSSPMADKFDSILVNTELGTLQALEYLYGLGHRHIAFLGGTVISDNGMNRNLPCDDNRKSAYIQFMKSHGIYNEALIFEGEKLSFQEGSQQCAKMLESQLKPTAAFVANDSMATGVIAKLYRTPYKNSRGYKHCRF
ncbi:substrate-binding domain-containing protein [uncultured Sphaerochaeta sp.]|uniref:substrate-binding domain-containing protein n=1 Tax=uncultured Sphaerochaeta sp. TaxID=886478 RepID=UPI002A0A9C0A|nr:substrate-binding domain-containing protein [uncultured Sphaerochaeta sp.]